jgi:hypothetical protein
MVLVLGYFLIGAYKEENKQRDFCESHGGTIYKEDCIIINEAEGIIINCEITDLKYIDLHEIDSIYNKGLHLLCEKRELYP